MNIAEETLQVFLDYMQDWREDPDLKVTPETVIATLELDDLATIEIQIALEAHFEMDNSGIPDGAWDGWVCIGDAIKYMEERLLQLSVS